MRLNLEPRPTILSAAPAKLRKPNGLTPLVKCKGSKLPRHDSSQDSLLITPVDSSMPLQQRASIADRKVHKGRSKDDERSRSFLLFSSFLRAPGHILCVTE